MKMAMASNMQSKCTENMKWLALNSASSLAVWQWQQRCLAAAAGGANASAAAAR